MGNFRITIDALKQRIGTPDCPPVFDVRRRPLYDQETLIVPTALWRDHMASDHWLRNAEPDTEVIVYCVHGHNVSQCAMATLRARGLNARFLEGGIEGWKATSAPVIDKSAMPHRDEDIASTWVTGGAPSVDRMASAWLVRRFIDREAGFLFVEPDQVAPIADEIGGIPFSLPNDQQKQDDSIFAFDSLFTRFGLDLPIRDPFVRIVAGADQPGANAAPESAGLRAIAFGLSERPGSDQHAAMESAMAIFDALYTRLRNTARSSSDQS